MHPQSGAALHKSTNCHVAVRLINSVGPLLHDATFALLNDEALKNPLSYLIWVKSQDEVFWTGGSRQLIQAIFRRRRHQPRSGREGEVQPPRLKKIASFHCGLTMSKGNCRANGISKRESNNQPDCKDD
jgi:hypothetical protein